MKRIAQVLMLVLGSCVVAGLALGATVFKDIATRVSPVYDVRAYGAVCDGVTNDATTIQAALDAATSGGVVQLPVGTCLVGTALTPKVGTTLRGSGINATIIKASAALAGVIQDNANGASVTLEDFQLDCNSTATLGVYVTSANRWTIRNLWIKNSASQGIDLTTSDDSIITGNRIDDSTNYGITIENGCNRTVISNNIVSRVTSAAADGIRLTNNCDGNSVSGNIVEDVKNIGILVEDNSDHNIIETNIVRGSSSYTPSNNAGYGIRVAGTTNPCNNNSVVGNLIHDLGASAAASGIEAITNAHYTIISGNQIRDALGYGINVTGSHFCTVTSNILRLPGGDPGIAISDGAVAATYEITINDNVVVGATVGIVVSSASSGFTISGNKVSLSLLSGIQIETASNGIVTGNNSYGNDVTPATGTSYTHAHSGIVVEGTSSYVTVANNVAWDAANATLSHGAATQDYGVFVGNSTTFTKIVGNKATGNTTASFSYGTSASNVVEHNTDTTSTALVYGSGTDADIIMSFDQGTGTDPRLVWDDTPGQFEFDFDGTLNDAADPVITGAGGEVVVTGGSANAGTVMWGNSNDATDTGTEVCTLAGLACVDVKTLAGVDSDCATDQGAAGTYFYALCN